MDKNTALPLVVAIALFVAGVTAGALTMTVVDDTGSPTGNRQRGITFDDPYEPTIDPADFVKGIDNPYYPMVPGTVWVYEGTSEEGLERIEFRVLEETRTVMGVECVVVRDTVSIDGEVIEDTYDWFAQDVDGNVWYFGEDSKEIENGQVVSTAGSWEAGVDGALPGIIMLAEPYVGITYRQEFYAGEAEDMATVLDLDGTISIRGDVYHDVLVLKAFTPLDPDSVEYNFVVPGVGIVAEGPLDNPVGRVELVDHTPPG
ncbi:MAG: hypothetical protein JSW25_00590 [Thermoplasmata archaeon]|nr:MAG: hypothetical protein JSW25_00590 [Thermoplasmata archaeon]